MLCIILLFGIWLAIHKKKGAHPADQTALTRIIALSILICFSDMFGWVCNGMTFPGADIVLHAVNMVYYFSTVAVCFEWLCYVEIRIYGTEKRGRVRSILRAAPLCAILVLVIINPVTGCLFSFGEGNVYQRGSLVFLHWIITGGYMLYGFTVCLRRVLSARSRTERRQYMPFHQHRRSARRLLLRRGRGTPSPRSRRGNVPRKEGAGSGKINIGFCNENTVCCNDILCFCVDKIQ